MNRLHRFPAVRSMAALTAITLALSLCITSALGQTPRHQWNIGFLESGDYPLHTELREHFCAQLPLMLPAEYTVVTVPQGFKSAGWNRDTCRAMAAALAADTSVHLVVAMGPWTVEDLLAAGFRRPIIAAYRYDPVAEGLADSTGRPVVDNLTVRIRPRRLETDLAALAALVHPKRLGLLLFPTGDEYDRLTEQARQLGKRLGFEVMTASGHDNKNTYAFYKAFEALADSVDAVYLGPLWGLSGEKTRQFFDLLLRHHVAGFSCEGEYNVVCGAVAAGNGEASEAMAYAEAWKAARIIQGARPADLPTRLPELGSGWINKYVAEALNLTVGPGLWLTTNLVYSPPADSVDRLSLAEAVGLALSQNPDLQSRKDVLEAAAAAARVARSTYLPQVNLDATAIRSDRNTVHNDDRYDRSRYGASLSIDQPLLALETIRDIQIANADRNLTQTGLAQSSLDLELAVAVAYLDARRLSQVENLAANYRMAVSRALQIARMKSILDDRHPSDDLRFDSEYRRALRLQVDARRDREVAGVLLNTLLGRPADAGLVATTDPASDNFLLLCEDQLQRLLATPEGTARVTDSLMAQAMKNSPTLEQTRLALNRQSLLLKRNTASFWPQIRLSGRLGLADAWRETPTFEEEHATWSIGASVNLPLFLGGSRIARRQQVRWEMHSLEYMRDAAYQRTYGEVQAWLYRMQASATNYALSLPAATSTSDFLTTVMEAYAAGDRVAIEAIDAARDAYATSSELLDAQTGCGLAAVHIMHQVGWRPGESVTSPEEAFFRRLRASMTGAGNGQSKDGH